MVLFTSADISGRGAMRLPICCAMRPRSSSKLMKACVCLSCIILEYLGCHVHLPVNMLSQQVCAERAAKCAYHLLLNHHCPMGTAPPSQPAAQPEPATQQEPQPGTRQPAGKRRAQQAGRAAKRRRVEPPAAPSAACSAPADLETHLRDCCSVLRPVPARLQQSLPEASPAPAILLRQHVDSNQRAQHQLLGSAGPSGMLGSSLPAQPRRLALSMLGRTPLPYHNPSPMQLDTPLTQPAFHDEAERSPRDPCMALKLSLGTSSTSQVTQFPPIFLKPSWCAFS